MTIKLFILFLFFFEDFPAFFTYFLADLSYFLGGEKQFFPKVLKKGSSIGYWGKNELVFRNTFRK